jgi:hypothetical protein
MTTKLQPKASECVAAPVSRPSAGHVGLDEVRESRLADPAQGQRGEGDAQLVGRKELSRCRVTPDSTRARRPPPETSSLTRVGRIFTMANSEATKKALASTIRAARSKAVLGFNIP